MKKTINQILDHLLDHVTIDQINSDEDLMYFYQRMVEKKSIYGGNHHIILQGKMIEIAQKHLPGLFTK